MEEVKTEEAVKTTKKSKRVRVPVGRVAVAVVLVALIGLSGYLFTELRDAKNNPDKVSQEQVESLVTKVGKLIVLPSDEQPTVATVQDKDKLKEQPFFSGAENGDKLLIYTKAQKAIIYRESTNSLVNVGPVSLDSEQAATSTDAGSASQ